MNKQVMLTVAAGLALPMLGLTAPAAVADTTLTLFEHDTVQYQADVGAPGPGPWRPIHLRRRCVRPSRRDVPGNDGRQLHHVDR